MSDVENGPTFYRGAVPVASAWEQLALAKLATGIFESDTFYVCDVTKLADALNAVRKTLDVAEHKPANAIGYEVLRSLHCDAYVKMDQEIKSGIKRAVWDVCGLSEGIGRFAFGEHWPQIEAIDVPPGGIATANLPVDAPPPTKWTLGGWLFVHSRNVIIGTGALLVAGLAFAISTIPTQQPNPVQVIDSSTKGSAAGVLNLQPPNLDATTGRSEALLDASVTTGNPADAARQLAATFKANPGKAYRVSVTVWVEE